MLCAAMTDLDRKTGDSEDPDRDAEEQGHGLV